MHAEKAKGLQLGHFTRASLADSVGLFKKDNVSFVWSKKALEMHVGMCFYFYLFTSVSLVDVIPIFQKQTLCLEAGAEIRSA